MYQGIAFKKRRVLGKITYLPAVSIILPFNPVITTRDQLEYSLVVIMQKIEQELLTGYTAEKAVPVLIKLKDILRNINYNTLTKSIAVFVSPVVSKVYYLDIEVQRKIVIDGSFEMRHIVLNKKQTLQYLVMNLGNNNCKIYIGNCSGFRLTANIPHKVSSNDFLKDIDQALCFILKAYPMPLILIATEMIMQRFRNITANNKDIIDHIEMCSEILQAEELQNILIPYEANWKYLKQVYLLNQLEKARDKHKLAYGITDVCNKAMLNKGKVLVIESKYLTPRSHLKSGSAVNKNYLVGNPFYVKDEVDEIIEKVLENGGDVEFIEQGSLGDYKHIALIEK